MEWNPQESILAPLLSRPYITFFARGGNQEENCLTLFSGSLGLHAAGVDLGMLKGGADTVQGRRKQFFIGTGTAEGSA